MKWKTSDIEALLKPLGSNIEVSSALVGEYNTDSVYLYFTKTLGHDRISIQGFREDRCLTSTSDDDVEHVEICDISGRGLESDDPALGKLYLDARRLLRKKGFHTTDSMDDWF